MLLCISPLYAQESRRIPPTAKVAVVDVESGLISPKTDFIGTVYYTEVSDVASEVNGMVVEAGFEEGQAVKQGDKLAILSSDLLKKTIQSKQASLDRILSELEKARRDLRRAERLYREKLISGQAYDEYRFRVEGLEKGVLSLEAEIERLGMELEKKTIIAPFDGVVIKKYITRGEWLSPGSPVATIAKTDVVDIVVDVPEEIIRHLTKATVVDVWAGGETLKGKVFAIIPKGDTSTRTFPVKIRIQNTLSLMEGMEARVSLPAGKMEKVLIVPRDALITVSDKSTVFTVIDSRARMIPVKVMGYRGMMAGIYADGLKEGMKVVVKGNERLRDGMVVEVK